MIPRATPARIDLTKSPMTRNSVAVIPIYRYIKRGRFVLLRESCVRLTKIATKHE